MTRLQFLIEKSSKYLDMLAQENGYPDWVSYFQAEEFDYDRQQVCFDNAKDWAKEQWKELEAAE